MLKNFRQWGKVVTGSFPDKPGERPEGFRGKPVIDFPRCTACDRCAEACPTQAITVTSETAENRKDAEGRPQESGGRIVSIDYGSCIFCGECEAACPDTIHLTRELQPAVSDRKSLITRARYRSRGSGSWEFVEIVADAASDRQSIEEIGARVKARALELFGRSLHIREVDAGSCNGCEIEITALNNPVYDIERFGIHFVASPRHADMLLVTGPVTRNMEIALRQSLEATPTPRMVVAAGACAIGGGIFGKSYASCGGVDKVIPVDVYIPGCPPHPEALLQGILTAMDRFPSRR
jgi:Ni,Fe-hydrogenase III small subunit/formate hydrogenlyase subunit 6/NADH:ubiquinone oxidoreductase subunit I